MRIGALIFPTDLTIRTDRLAREMEDRGFESLWVTEHTHIPTSRRTPWPGGSELPEEYRRTLDPFVGLAAAAAVTERLNLGTGICLVAQHHPITLAKSVASLDLMSDGRFLFGIGVGWNEDEMENHGVDPHSRRARVRESVLAMKGLWTEEAAGYDGDHVSFSASWSWPKPVRFPHPPVIMGGAGGPVTFRHIVEYCDGWMPIHGRRNVFERVGELRAAAEAAGRDPDSIELGVFGCPIDAEVVDSYRAAGFTRAVFWLPHAGADRVLPVLDAGAPLVQQFATAG
jgi:probable F420-dependent oxidoreductase